MSNLTHKDVIKSIQKKIDLKKELRNESDSKQKDDLKKKISSIDNKIRSQPLPKL